MNIVQMNIVHIICEQRTYYSWKGKTYVPHAHVRQPRHHRPITGALVLYTIGVFRERADGSLRGPHVVLFWLGLACDTAGTTLMSIIARTSAEAAPAIHGITGLAAILLMLFHAGWATLVYFQGKRGGAAALKRERTFHRLSAAVWVAWLVPYVIGMLVGIPMIKLGVISSSSSSMYRPLSSWRS